MEGTLADKFKKSCEMINRLNVLNGQNKEADKRLAEAGIEYTGELTTEEKV